MLSVQFGVVQAASGWQAFSICTSMHFGDYVPESIEKEYNRMLLHEQYLDKKEQKFRVQTVDFDEVIAVCPDPSTLPINEIEVEHKRIHDARLKYLPVALGLLKSEFPHLYQLITEYYYAEAKITMSDFGESHGLTKETVRYRIRSAREKLKAYIIMHEKKM